MRWPIDIQCQMVRQLIKVGELRLWRVEGIEALTILPHLSLCQLFLLGE